MAALQVLNFDNNFLSGVIPSEIGALLSIREMVLSNNFIAGTMPSEIGNLLTLEVLNLEGPTQGTMNIGGTIPTQIGNLAFLRKLLAQVGRLFWGLCHTPNTIHDSFWLQVN